MPLWPFIPQQGPTESLEWFTDVNRCRGAEQRFAQRLVPRQGFQYEHILTDLQFSRMKSFARYYGASEFDLPLWWEFTEVGALAAGTDTLAFDTQYAHYLVGGKVVVWDADDKWEVCTVATLTVGGLTFTPPLVNTYASAVIAPAKAVRFASVPEAERGPYTYVRARATFFSTEMQDLSDASAYPTYLTHPVLTDRSVVLESLAEKFQREFELIDGETGKVDAATIYTYPTETSMMGWSTLTRAELWALRKWLHSRRGKQKGFWLPTWNNDLQVTANINAGSNQLTVKPIGYPTQETVRDIMIRSTAGVNTYKRVNSGATVGANEVLTMSSTAGVTLTPAQVEMVCFLNFMRFDADRIEIKHRVGGGASINVPVMEAPVP